MDGTYYSFVIERIISIANLKKFIIYTQRESKCKLLWGPKYAKYFPLNKLL